MFRNPEIALEELPGMEELDWHSLHSSFVRRVQLERLGLVLIALAATTVPKFIVGPEFLGGLPVWALVILFAVPYLWWPVISVPRRGYVLRDKDIIFRSGVIWRSVTAVPFNRIQHVESTNSLLDRRFGLANLQIFTAGGSGGDLQISGVGADTAEKLRVYILDKVGASIETH